MTPTKPRTQGLDDVVNLVAGSILAATNQRRMRKERVSQMREQSSMLTDYVSACLKGNDDEDLLEALKRAWTAFRLTAIRPDSFGAASFRLTAMHEVFDAIKSILAEEALDAGADY